VGLSIHNVRAQQVLLTFFDGTNGTSIIVPMLRVFNDTARYDSIKEAEAIKGSLLSTCQKLGMQMFF
jgi:hypothetical protein